MLKFDIKCLFFIFLFSILSRAIIRPITVQGCRSIDNKNKCTECQESYHLVQQVCIRVLVPIQSTGGITKSEYDQLIKPTGSTTTSSRDSNTNKDNVKKILPYKNVTVDNQEQKLNKKYQTLSAPGILITGCIDQANGACLRCAYGYFKYNGYCKTVSNQCKTWNQGTGFCTSCYGGYELSSGDCVIEKLEIPQAGCMEQKKGVCLKCAFRYFNSNGICKVVNDQCRSWNEKTGACTECYGSYRLSGYSCIIGNQPQPPSASRPTLPIITRVIKPIILPPTISSSINSITSNKYSISPTNPSIYRQSSQQNKIPLSPISINSQTKPTSSIATKSQNNQNNPTKNNKGQSRSTPPINSPNGNTQISNNLQTIPGEYDSTPNIGWQNQYIQSVAKPILLTTDTQSLPANESPDFSLDSWLASLSLSSDSTIANALIASIINGDKNGNN